MEVKYYTEITGNKRKISVLLPQNHKKAIGEGKNLDFGFFNDKTKQMKVTKFSFLVNADSGNCVLSFELHRLHSDSSLIEGLITAAVELLGKS